MSKRKLVNIGLSCPELQITIALNIQHKVLDEFITKNVKGWHLGLDGLYIDVVGIGKDLLDEIVDINASVLELSEEAKKQINYNYLWHWQCANADEVLPSYQQVAHIAIVGGNEFIMGESTNKTLERGVMSMLKKWSLPRTGLMVQVVTWNSKGVLQESDAFPEFMPASFFVRWNGSSVAEGDELHAAGIRLIVDQHGHEEGKRFEDILNKLNNFEYPTVPGMFPKVKRTWDEGIEKLTNFFRKKSGQVPKEA